MGIGLNKELIIWRYLQFGVQNDLIRTLVCPYCTDSNSNVPFR